jgi:hypothetical protein
MSGELRAKRTQRIAFLTAPVPEMTVEAINEELGHIGVEQRGISHSLDRDDRFLVPRETRVRELNARMLALDTDLTSHTVHAAAASLREPIATGLITIFKSDGNLHFLPHVNYGAANYDQIWNTLKDAMSKIAGSNAWAGQSPPPAPAISIRTYYSPAGENQTYCFEGMGREEMGALTRAIGLSEDAVAVAIAPVPQHSWNDFSPREIPIHGTLPGRPRTTPAATRPAPVVG